MDILSRLKLGTKLGLLIGLSVLTLIAAIAVAASLMRQRLIEERIDKMHAVVDTAVGISGVLEQRVAAGQMTRDQALHLMRDEIHAMRFDRGAGYIYAQTLDNLMVWNGGSPALEGKQSPAHDQDGRPLTDLIRAALAHGDDGVVSYAFPKPGQSELQPKVSYVERFAPWGLVFGAGAYIDDVDVTLRATIVRLGAISGAILCLTLLIAWLLNRDIGGSLGKLKTAMGQLADGKLATEIPGTARRDEVGAMAGAVLVFQDHMAKAERLAAAQEQERRQAVAEKAAALHGMADSIEAETATAVRQVATRTTAMTAIADEMAELATRTSTSAQSAAAASAQALANTQTVATAAEQLAVSIRGIGGEVTHSSEVVGRAVAAGRETRSTIEALNEEVGRIGAVADMIGEIASKTNLLALNATIEAARAGDAGKGFAVVASEVKALAAQTARSTQEIAQHIGQVRSATEASVAAVARIEQTIGEIDAIAGSIAAAVQQQGATTAEIARNVAEAVSAANEMAHRNTEVLADAEQTGIHAGDVRENAAALNSAVEELRHSVIRVVRTATPEVDRRADRRHDVDLPCRVSAGGRTLGARLVDLSDGGARVQGAPPLQAGERGTLAIDGVGMALPFVVRHSAGDVLHVAFALDAATAARFAGTAARLARRRAA